MHALLRSSNEALHVFAGIVLTLTNPHRVDRIALDELDMLRGFLLHRKYPSNPVEIHQHAESRSSRIDALQQKYLPVLLHLAQQIGGVLQSQMTLVRLQVSIDPQLGVLHFAIFEVLLGH